MKRLTRTLPILLAVALQILPLVRNLFLNPATGSNIAFILRWGIGTGAALGAVDAVSGASGTYMNTSSNITGTVGVPLQFTNIFVINGGNAADINTDFIFVNTKINNTGTSSPNLTNGNTTSIALPPGLSIKCIVVTGATNISSVISGIPSTVVVSNISITAGYYGGYTFTTNLHFQISAAPLAPPAITNHPAAFTTVAGGGASFTVVAGGATPLSYQWKFNTNTALLNATNSSLTLTNVRAGQAGMYSVTITNASGSTNSLFALLTVTNPLPPSLAAPTISGGVFQFTFIPVVGLTNSVVTNSALSGGIWTVLTNLPPPANANPITVSDPFGSSNRFYRVVIQP